MIGRDIEHRGHLALVGAMAHKAAIAAAAECQRQRIKKNGFARTGLPGEDRKSGVEFEIELLDQDDIAKSTA